MYYFFLFFSFCVGIFGAFEKCRKAAQGETVRGDGEGSRGLKNTVTERLNRFGFEGGFEFFLPLQSSFVCLFCFPARAQTVVYVVFSVLVVAVSVCFVNFHCYPKMAALFVLTFFRISFAFFLL